MGHQILVHIGTKAFAIDRINTVSREESRGRVVVLYMAPLFVGLARQVETVALDDERHIIGKDPWSGRQCDAKCGKAGKPLSWGCGIQL